MGGAPCCEFPESNFRGRITAVITELNISEARRFTLLHRYVAVAGLEVRVGKYAGREPADTFATFVNNVETMCAAAVAEILAITPLPQLQRGGGAAALSAAFRLGARHSVAGTGVSTLIIGSEPSQPLSFDQQAT